METRRRSARLQAHEAAANEEPKVITTKAQLQKTRKRKSEGKVEEPPKIRERRNSGAAKKDKQPARRSTAYQIEKSEPNKESNENVTRIYMNSIFASALNLSEESDLDEEIITNTKNDKYADVLVDCKDDSQTSLKLDDAQISNDPAMYSTMNESNIELRSLPDITQQITNTTVSRRDSNTSLESFDMEEEKIPVPTSKSRTHTTRPRVSHIGVSYKTRDNDTDESTEESIDDSDNFDPEEVIEKEDKPKRSTRKRQHASSDSEDAEDDNDDVSDELDEEIEEVKKKSTRKTNGRKSRGKGGGGGRNKVSNVNDTGKIAVRRSSGGNLKTPANKGIRPWERNTGKVFEGDIVIPPRKLRRGEQKMFVFRILAAQFAVERNTEIDLDEGYRLLEQIKREINADREGYIRRILMTGGRDPDTEFKEKKDENKIENDDGSSSSEDEWLEMEPVERVDRSKKLVVTVDNQEDNGYDWWALYLRQEVNKQIRKKWENSHKVHILAYIAHLQYIVKTVLNEETIPYLLLTQLPASLAALRDTPLSKTDAQKIATWYSINFKPAGKQLIIPVDQLNENLYPETARYAYLASQKFYETDLERSALLFALFVSLGAVTRLCINTRPIPRRWDDEFAQKKSNQKKSSSNSEGQGSSGEKPKGKKKKVGTKINEINYWVEYWNVKEKRWICINPSDGKLDVPEEIEILLHKPIFYIFAVDNKLGIRDVSARYSSEFCRLEFRRRRTEGPWLTRTLNLDTVKADSHRAKLEDVHFRTEMVTRPLPKTIGEYKNHPLYVLERHLLKFQAIYPPPYEQTPLGEIRGEKVYPRDSVHTLLGVQKWEKLARSVKVGEKPYKTVKAITDPRIPPEERTDKYVDIYGYWQTEPWRAENVVNGIIPKNEYGNVYMYQPIMCPIGAVHLRLPDLPKIARRLNKECVPAVVGWDFNHCGNWPIIDGAVVLEEDRELFVNEWKNAEVERVAREKKKKEERAMKNWKKLIQGMIRLHRVKTKFGHTDTKAKGDSKKGRKKHNKKEETTQESDIIDNTQQPDLQEYTLHEVMRF